MSKISWVLFGLFIFQVVMFFVNYYSGEDVRGLLFNVVNIISVAFCSLFVQIREKQSLKMSSETLTVNKTNM